MKKVLSQFDYLKFVLAIIVIAIHTIGKENIGNIYISNIVNTIFSIAVPLFFIISSYLFFSKDTEKNVLKQKILYYIRIYIKWSLIYLPINFMAIIKQNTNIFDIMKKLFQEFFILGQGTYSWPLWYLLATVYAYILIYIIWGLKIKEQKKCIILVICSIVSIIIARIYVDSTNNIVVFFGNFRILQGIYYSCIGLFIGKYQIKVNKYILIIVCILTFGLSSFFLNEWIIDIMIVAVFMYLLLYVIVERKNSIIFRVMSMIMYYIHMLVKLFILVLLKKPNYGFDVFIITTCTSIAISILFYIFDKKFNKKISKLLF